MLRILITWLPMVPLAIANGVLRQATYGQWIPELRAHQLSTLTGVVIIGAYVLALHRLRPFVSERQALATGAGWLLLTVAFEFGFGHWVAGHTWSRLLHDYDLRAGRVWSLFLLFVAASPWLAWRWRR